MAPMMAQALVSPPRPATSRPATATNKTSSSNSSSNSSTSRPPAQHQSHAHAPSRQTPSNTLPDSLLLCPITQEVMRDPVIAADGHCYERAAIASWLAGHDTSPMTNVPMPHKHLTANHQLRSAALEYIQRNGA
ncbi:MAG: hypothetical protein WDW38_001402 [Sanguina aurantia]